MGVPTFDELIKSDMQDVFLTGDFSQTAIYKSPNSLKPITIQFFESDLDAMSTQFHHAWVSFDTLPQVNTEVDTLEVNKIVYGIKSASPDEFNSGLNLFLQKV